MTKNVLRTPASRVRFGHARVDVTPPVGIYHRLWGAARHDRATGVHRPLFADVLAVGPLEAESDGASRSFVRIHLDSAGLAQGDQDGLIRVVSDATGVERDRVVIAHSHTHSGSWLMPDRVPLSGGELIAPYLADLAEKVRNAAGQAILAMQPATINYANGWCDMGANRDFWDESRQIFVCGFNPAAPSGQPLLVARVTDDQGGLRCTLVNYGCHPTTLAWQNSLLSPDFPGAMRETVEAATGGPCVFAQGACGDVGPRHGFTGDTAVADRNGAWLGLAALAALQSLPPPLTELTYQGPVVSGATLGIWEPEPLAESRRREQALLTGGTFTVDLALKPRPDAAALCQDLETWEQRAAEADARGDAVEARNCRAHAERARRWVGRLHDFPPGATYPLHCSAFRLGDAIWVTSGGEPYSAVQTELRRRFPEQAILFSPLGGDLQVAYLLEEACYGTGRYQEEPSILAPGCLEALTEALAARITSLL